MNFLDVQPGDVVRLRKQHPCGGWAWTVVRIGADIGLVCTTCQRRLMLPRQQFRKAVRQIIPGVRQAPADSDPQPDTSA
ncbi:MAG: DUF951 domain-containing protein [Chloroflexi bacterium]|nr:DUF951 domain-containing protein [Chloroflexota bacterium]